MRVTGLDHIVIVAPDPAATARWYGEKLGLPIERLEEFERGEVLFPSLRIDPTTIVDVLPGERTGRNLDHFCLVVADVDLDELAARDDLEVLGGPSELWGALGLGRSVYVRDPDGTTVELRTYEGQ